MHFAKLACSPIELVIRASAEHQAIGTSTNLSAITMRTQVLPRNMREVNCMHLTLTVHATRMKFYFTVDLMIDETNKRKKEGESRSGSVSILLGVCE